VAMPQDPHWEAVVTGAAAVFGLLVSGAVLAVAVAGFLQWGPTYPAAIDEGLPLLVMVVAMLLAGRVAVDVAGRRGVLSAVGGALIVAAIGVMVSRSSEAHGDAVEPPQVLLATVVVLVLTGGSAWFVAHHRASRGAASR
jgi:hypothetical protein